MRRVESAAAAVLLSVAASVVAGATAAAADGEWIQLFNGRDLDGWTAKIRGHEAGVDFADTFRVRDGILEARCAQYGDFGGRFGHLFHDGVFSHYRLRVEYRFVGEQCPGGPDWALRNSGVMIHGQSPESMDRDQDFPVAVEVQLLGGTGAGPRPTANVCTPGTEVAIGGRREPRHCVESSAATYDGERWVVVEVEVHGGDVVRHWIDGRLVLEYSDLRLDDGTPLTAGTISLQSESHPVDFRRVELLPLAE
jgi:3-keto-disaccharide hydrolase